MFDAKHLDEGVGRFSIATFELRDFNNKRLASNDKPLSRLVAVAARLLVPGDPVNQGQVGRFVVVFPNVPAQDVQLDFRFDSNRFLWGSISFNLDRALARRPSETLVALAARTPTRSPEARQTAAVTSTPVQVPTPTSSPVAEPAATPDSTQTPNTYVVQSGDTLGAIADRFGTTIGALLDANSIADPNLLSVGQTLTIPAPADVGIPVERQPETLECPTTRQARYFGDVAVLVGVVVAGAVEQVGEVSSEMANDPLVLFNSGWRQRVITALATMRAGAELLRGLEAPVGVEEIHRLVSELADDLDGVVVNMAEGIDTFDAAKVDTAADAMAAAANKIVRMTELMSTFCG